MEQTIELPAFRRSAELAPNSIEPETRSVEVIWSTGARVRRAALFGEPHDEELSMAPEHVRLERLNAGAPFLKVHEAHDLDAVIGSVVPGSARIENGQGIARIRLSERDAVGDIWRDIEADVWGLNRLTLGGLIAPVCADGIISMKSACFGTFVALFFAFPPASSDAQAWRDCIPGSIGPGGCDSIGPGGGRSIGPGGGLSIGPGGGLSIGPGGGQSIGPGGGRSIGPGGGLSLDRDRSRGLDTRTMRPFQDPFGTGSDW